MEAVPARARAYVACTVLGALLCLLSEMLEDFATIAGIETVHINADTTLPQLKQDLRNNEVFYHLENGFKA